MRVTIDLDKDIIIIPDNFFKRIAEDNERLEKYGATPVKAIDRIKHSFEVAMGDTDNRLLTQTNAKTSRASKKKIDLNKEEKSKDEAKEAGTASTGKKESSDK